MIYLEQLSNCCRDGQGRLKEEFVFFIFYTPSREFELVSASGKVQLLTREAAEDFVVCWYFFFFVCLFKLLIISVCAVFLFFFVCFVFLNRSTLNFCFFLS